MEMNYTIATGKKGKKCLDAAYRLLSRRDHGRVELTRKLKERGFSDEQIDRAVAQCIRYDYLDDDRFAHNQTLRLQGQGYGTRRIRQSLRAKGLAPDLIDAAISRHCTEQAQLEQCRHVLRRKIDRKSGTRPTWELKSKLYRYLLGRGFSPSLITTVLDGTLDEIDTG